MLHSHLLTDTVQLAADDQVLILNSAADPFVRVAAQQLSAGIITLAEDNIAALQGYQGLPVPQTGFHYLLLWLDRTDHTVAFADGQRLDIAQLFLHAFRHR